MSMKPEAEIKNILSMAEIKHKRSMRLFLVLLFLHLITGGLVSLIFDVSSGKILHETTSMVLLLVFSYWMYCRGKLNGLRSVSEADCLQVEDSGIHN